MGCQMNERDSETVAGMLESLGYEKATGADSLTGLRDEADIIIVNTCSVRENADNKFFGVLGQIKKSKEANPAKIVAVCGCMMQQEIIRKEIRDKFGWVDIVFGTQNIGELPELLRGVESPERNRAWRVIDEMPDITEGLPAKREYPFKAFVSVIYGCNNFCTYCIVPYTRGREKSRAPEAVVSEVRELCESGVKEITLLGQNVNSYRGVSGNGTAKSPSLREASATKQPIGVGIGGRLHSSVDNGEIDFADLIKLIAPTPGLERLRFMTSHPKDLSDKLISLYAELPNLCPAIHLPIQSGSTEILRRMNRRYTKDDYLELVRKLRKTRPDIAITTDLIVGFPGETDADFEETMDVIERVRFDSAFTFLYSPRTGTPAADYANRIPEDVKRRRFDRMVARLNEITLEKNREYLGRVESVLVESPSKTRSDIIVLRNAKTFTNRRSSFRYPSLSSVAVTKVTPPSFASASKKYPRRLLTSFKRYRVLAGRTLSGKLVNFPAPENAAAELIGEIIPVEITGVNTFSFAGRMAR
jgi:tRNA-2-methylthio-N6-dimethylallyladenosine synthase